MKSYGKNLERDYDQLFDSYTHIALRLQCNIGEFWIYDFNIQSLDPFYRF